VNVSSSGVHTDSKTEGTAFRKEEKQRELVILTIYGPGLNYPSYLYVIPLVFCRTVT
jgi:hypothetical protein